MLFPFDSLPGEVKVTGNFGSSCFLTIRESSLASLRRGTLKLEFMQLNWDGKTSISGLETDIGAGKGVILVRVGDDNARVHFSENTSGLYDVRLWRCSKVSIGPETTSNGATIVCYQSEVITGRDCMFSDGILIQSSDQHGLVDLRTGDIINNRPRRVILGNHVWLGRGCTLMPDTTIGDGSVIGTGAIVTKDIPAMSIAVGVPARIIKSQVTWSRSLDYLDEMSQAYVNQHPQVNAMPEGSGQ